MGLSPQGVEEARALGRCSRRPGSTSASARVSCGRARPWRWRSTGGGSRSPSRRFSTRSRSAPSRGARSRRTGRGPGLTTPATPARVEVRRRVDAAVRIAAGLDWLLERPEEAILAVSHALPIRYVLDASDGAFPGRRIAHVPHAAAVPARATGRRARGRDAAGMGGGPGLRGYPVRWMSPGGPPPMHTVDVLVRRSHLVLAILVAVLALVASGCGATSVAAPELTSFATAAKASAAADSARFALQLKMTMPLTRQVTRIRAPTAASTRLRGAPSSPSTCPRSPRRSRASASSFGGTDEGRPGRSRGLEARGDPGRRRRLRVLPAHRRAAPRREEMGQGRREGALRGECGPARPVRLVRRHRPARRVRDAEGGLRLDRGARHGRDPRRRDEPLQGHDRRRQARAARPGGAAAEPRRPRRDGQGGGAERPFRSRSGSTATSGCESSRWTSTRSSRGRARP